MTTSTPKGINMSDRQYIPTGPRTVPNPHDVAMAVFRPEIYTEAAKWLKSVDPGAYRLNPAYKYAVDEIEARRDQAKAAPGAGMLDHASAGYARHFADSIEAAGYVGAAGLLRRTADDLDGGLQ